MGDTLKCGFSAIAVAVILSAVTCQYVYMPSVVYTQTRDDEFNHDHPLHMGNLYLPVDGRNATLDCNNYDRSPTDCAKIPHCEYHCHSGRCRDSDTADEKNCSQYCLDVCGCKQRGCFDVAGVNCRPMSGCPFDPRPTNPKGPPLTLRKSNRFPFNLCPDGITLQRISPKRGDFEYVPVISVNLGGERHVDEEGWIFEADSSVEADDPDSIKEQGEIAAEEITGVSEADKPLFRTYIKGSAGGEGDSKCVNYVANLCEEGNYLLDLKVVEPEHEESGARLFDVKINNVVVLDELNILAWTKKKGRVAEILVRFYYGSGEELVVGGQRGNVTDGEIIVSFCQGNCPNATDRGFVASAFQVLHWQRSINVNGRVISHRGDECRCRILAGKEFNYETTLCNTARECSPCAVKSSCMRANTVYVSGGMACKNRFARGSCIVEEVIAAVNINGRAHHDSRGIRYVADDDKLFDDPYRLRYDYDGDILSYGSCPVDPYTRHVVTGVVSADAILYETFTRSYSSGSTGMCMTYNISDTIKKDGKYELVMKMVEPMYEQPGQRSFSIHLFHDDEEGDKPVVGDFDILKFSEPCEATDIVVSFEISDGGSIVQLQGHDSRELTEARMQLGFCLSSCSENITNPMVDYDPDFIVSAYYIAKLSEKSEPHVTTEDKTDKPSTGGGSGEGDKPVTEKPDTTTKKPDTTTKKPDTTTKKPDTTTKKPATTKKPVDNK